MENKRQETDNVDGTCNRCGAMTDHDWGLCSQCRDEMDDAWDEK